MELPSAVPTVNLQIKFTASMWPYDNLGAYLNDGEEGDREHMLSQIPSHPIPLYCSSLTVSMVSRNKKDPDGH